MTPLLAKIYYLLQLADNALVLGHRISEWCGHGPVLEQDIAITNTSLDHIGQARSFYQYAAELYSGLTEEERKEAFTSPMLDTTFLNKGVIDEDDLAYLRDAWDFKNALLVEQSNADWAYTIARSFFYDAYQLQLYTALLESNDTTIVAIAEKSLKEVKYHLRWSSEWMIRLGDGTEESAARMRTAVAERWAFTGELFKANEVDAIALTAGYGADLNAIHERWVENVTIVFDQAQLAMPASDWMQGGGKTGTHSEHLGYLLAEMQFMQRTYPGMVW